MRRILHCDMDAFYAAVHVRDEPALAGRPVVIGGSPEGRGVVAAASYEARRFGVRSAMPAARARRLCSGAVFLEPDFPRYRRESEAIFEIFRRYTPLVQAVSIDEAYLDVGDHLDGRGSATAVAREIKERVRAERRLTVSIGVGPNRLVAKIASDFDKPDGLTVVPPRKVLDFLAPLPVRSLPGVGPATERVLRDELGIATIAELRAQPAEALAARFGRHGDGLYRYARGIDERPVETRRERKSLGTETTYGTDLEDLEVIEGEIARLAAEVAAGLAGRHLVARTVTVKVRYQDFTTVTRSHSMPWPVDRTDEIAVQARRLVRLTEAGRRRVRLLGVSASNLESAGEGQLPLFD